MSEATGQDRTAWAEDLRRRQDDIIESVGWAVVGVFPTEDQPDAAPFGYTVGLTAHGYPELVIAGLPLQTTHALLNDLAQRVYDKAERFTNGQRVADLVPGYDMVICNGRDTEQIRPTMAYNRYGTGNVRLQQIVWPDREGRFPWEDGYSMPADAQPLLDPSVGIGGGAS